jgi:broad specificity phosphatase PhoE
MDVIQRLEPVIIEMERERECVLVVAHQAVLRAILGYFLTTPLEDIPKLDILLHTVIELRPRPDGTMEVEHLPVPITTAKGEGAPPHTYPQHLPISKAPVQVSQGTPL